MSRWTVGLARDIENAGDNSFIGPACRELGLAWLAYPVPVAAACLVPVEYVGGSFRGDADVLGLRPVLGINRIPPRTFRTGPFTAIISRLTGRGDPKRLVIFLAAPRLRRLRPPRGNITIRRLPLGPVEVVEVLEVVVRPI
jgi:hypothetical protein